MVAINEMPMARRKREVRRVRKTVTNGGLAGNIPNGTADSIWFGWQTMEERNPSGSTDTPTKQYVWGSYIDECLQLNLLAVAGPQQLAVGVYYPLQDTLYRTMALVNSSGTPVEAYDTDPYGNTIIFTGPGADNTWFTDDDTQSSYGASDIIYCGYRYDAETDNCYVRNRYYSPTLGRWLTRDPIGYQGGINLYGYVESGPVGNVDAEGTKWTITRDGKARATVSGQKGDTINSLLQTKDNHGNLILLDSSQYRKWLKPLRGSKLPATAASPLKCGEKFTIPNTAWIFDNISATRNWGWAFAQGVLLGLTLDGVDDAWAVKWRRDGLDVHNTGPGYQGSFVALRRAFKSLDTYAIGIISHTDETDRGALVFNSKYGNLLMPGEYSSYGLGELKIYACHSASPYRAAGSTDSVANVWSGNVSKAGWYTGWAGYLGTYQYFNNAGLVRIHGSQ